MIRVDNWRAIDKTSSLSVDGKSKENAIGKLIIKLGAQNQVNEQFIQNAKTPEQKEILTKYVDLISRIDELVNND